MKIAARVGKIQPSLTLAVSAKAAKLKAEGKDIVAFGVGEPDFDTPEHVKAAAVAALQTGVSKYTAVSGTLELRAAVAEELGRAHDVKLVPEQVIISVGAKHSLYNLLMAFLDDGDEVIIPAPCWVSYPELVQMAGGIPRLLHTRPSEKFRFDEGALRSLVTPKTRAILLNSPCNPTGAVYDGATLDAVIKVARAHPEIVIVTDDIYRRLVYGVPWLSIAKRAPDLANRIVLVDGVSKSYAMTGWRIGFCAGPRELIGAMDTLQGQSTSNPTAIAQAAALAALTGSHDPVEAMRLEFDRRRQAMVARLGAIADVKLVTPEGAFYCFPDLSAYLDTKMRDDIALAEHFLQHGVALVPGSGFFAPGFVRISYATSMAQIEKGLDRIATALSALRLSTNLG